MDKNSNIIEINLRELLRTLLKRLWIIILIAAIFATAAGYYSKNYLQSYYTSSAKLFILNKQTEDKTMVTDLQIGTILTKDYMILIKSRPVMDAVIKKLNLNMTTGELAGMISVNSPEDTRILEISVTYTDPAQAKLIVDTVADNASKSMVNIMGIDEVNVVEEGNLPVYPSGPNVNRNIKLAGLTGGALVILLITIVFLLNDTIKSTEDIEKYLGLVTLGVIPVEGKKYKRYQKKMARQKNKIAA